MKRNILLLFCTYSLKIISYTFWLYFLFILVLNYFHFYIDKALTYLFWLLLGIYIGFSAATKIIKFMRKYS